MNQKKEKEFQSTGEMYTTLFNGITDARNYLRAVDDLLNNIQQKAEQLYIEDE